MSDIVLAALVGGAVATVSGLITLFVNLYDKRAQRRYELTLKRVEVYETEKRDALLDYAKLLGVMSGEFISNGISVSDFLAASGKVVLFLPRDARLQASVVDRLVRIAWRDGAKSASECNLAHEPDFVLFREIIANELQKTVLNCEIQSNENHGTKHHK